MMKKSRRMRQAKLALLNTYLNSHLIKLTRTKLSIIGSKKVWKSSILSTQSLQRRSKNWSQSPSKSNSVILENLFRLPGFSWTRSESLTPNRKKGSNCTTPSEMASSKTSKKRVYAKSRSLRTSLNPLPSAAIQKSSV